MALRSILTRAWIFASDCRTEYAQGWLVAEPQRRPSKGSHYLKPAATALIPSAARQAAPTTILPNDRNQAPANWGLPPLPTQPQLLPPSGRCVEHAERLFGPL